MNYKLVKKVSLSKLLNQVFDDLRQRFLDEFQSHLEQELLLLRDRIIGSKPYQRGFRYKRWGYSLRKYIQTPIGVLSCVRIPRIRHAYKEVNMFLDRYVKRMGLLNEWLLEQFIWGMSLRRLEVIQQRLYQEGLTIGALSRLKRPFEQMSEKMRSKPIDNSHYEALVVDGIYGRYRKKGKGVCLVAIGVDHSGHAELLSWRAALSESTQSWYRLFLDLRNRGLRSIKLLVSDDTSGVQQAIDWVWGKDTRHQLCLWHMSQTLERYANQKHNAQRQARYWAIFNAPDREEAYQRFEEFCLGYERSEPDLVGYLCQKQGQLFRFYDFPGSWRHRVRTTNLAEGFFSRLNPFLKRFPGWQNEKHIMQVVGLFHLGSKAFNHYKKNLKNPEMPSFYSQISTG